jgi:hypothetical protein
MVKSQFRAIGRQMKIPANMFAMHHRMMKSPIPLAQSIMERTGKMAKYMSKTETFVNRAFAFHKSANAMIP